MENILISGFFDPLHVGHINLICHAASYGRVIIALNTDIQAYLKKGFVFMPYDERLSILSALADVDRVIKVMDDDETICKTLEYIRPTYFANGGDRVIANTKEDEVCKRLNIQQLFNIGGKKIQSSTALIKRVAMLREGLGLYDYI